MTTRVPPGMQLSLTSLSAEPNPRHEELVDLFGQYIFWMRNWTNESARKLVESSDFREQLGTILRKPYENVAAMPQQDRERAYALAESSVDAFITLLLRVLSHRGTDFRLGSGHAIRFRLELELVDQETDEVVLEETINRNGKKHFADYWGMWINRHRDK